MSARHRFTSLPRLAALSIAFATAAALAACAPTAASDDSYVFGLVTPTPMVHLAMSGATSDAQLIQQLQRQGYSDIKVTPLSPNIFDPRPELLHTDLTYSSPDDPKAQDTPIHFGWNGTADRNGRTFEVYVDATQR
jgi:hypothetical protein